VDFYFALLPWIFIWKLNMKFKEKMSIAISLSLGFMYVVGLSAFHHDETDLLQGVRLWGYPNYRSGRAIELELYR
jgi:hypothetical protein